MFGRSLTRRWFIASLAALLAPTPAMAWRTGVINTQGKLDISGEQLFDVSGEIITVRIY